MRQAAVVVALMAAAYGSSGLAAPTVQNRQIEALRSRLFPALSHLDPSRLPAPAAAALSERAARRSACKGATACLLTADLWSEAEIAAVANIAATDPKQTLALRTELQGVNIILQTYGLGAPPRYAEIDGPDLNRPELFQANVAAALKMRAAPPLAQAVEIDESLTLSLALLDAADRLDPVRLEPQFETLNAPAFARARKLDWRAYPYTAILALGVGPEDTVMPLSPLGKLNVQAAAQLYFNKQAPYIIVSGSAVHPRRTPYVEAFEMRKALIERFAVPAEAIIVDPFARHTTTNLRNASRLLMGLRAPSSMEAVVVSNEPHISSVANPAFVTRNLNELGYMPVTLGRRLSPTSMTFTPDPRSTLVDPRDPLDP